MALLSNVVRLQGTGRRLQGRALLSNHGFSWNLGLGGLYGCLGLPLCRSLGLSLAYLLCLGPLLLLQNHLLLDVFLVLLLHFGLRQLVDLRVGVLVMETAWQHNRGLWAHLLLELKLCLAV